MSRNIVVAGDPGKTTGIVVASVSRASYQILEARSLVWEDRFTIRDILHRYQEELIAVVIEEFRLFNNHKTMQAQVNSDFPSVRIIGNVEAWLYDRGIVNLLCFQTPADRKNVKIPAVHQKLVGPIDHTQDAYRHLRYWWLVNKRKLAE